MRGEAVRNDNGKAEIIPSSPVLAGSEGQKWTLIYTVGKLKLKAGGGIRIDIPYGFTAPQVMYPGYPGYIKAFSSNPQVKLTTLLFDTQVKRAWGSEYWITEGKRNVFKISFWAYQVFIKVLTGELKEGEKIQVKYGFAEWPPGAGTITVPRFSQRFEFTVATDVDGKRTAPLSGYYLIEKSPSLEVVGGETEKVNLYFPSVVKQKQVEIKLVARDKYSNASSSFKGKIIIGEKKIKLSQSTQTLNLSLPPKGKLKIEVKEGRKKIPLVSSPFVKRDKKEESLYWGDLHAHTRFSDGLGTPEECYEFAQKVAALDFAAIADHSAHFSEEEWEKTLEVNEHYHQPGKFVTFHGFELNVKGDRNVYYLKKDKPIYPYHIHQLKPGGMEGNKRPFQEIKKILWEKKGLIIHHQHAGPLREEHYLPELFRLVEIYSIWGNCEYRGCPRPIGEGGKIFVQDYLARGWKLGFIGGSDCHAGRPGESNWLRRQYRYHNGLTAIYAPELTREALWNSLWQRKCYATTGHRPFIEFKINHSPMGAEIELPHKTAPRRIQAEIIGTEVLEKIELIKNNQVILTLKSRTERKQIDWVDQTQPSKEDYYYLRVTQKDKELAWTSPIWVKPPPHRG
jgi:hypothetical protein